jgi:tetratricopeptide (TPR) repeat protein
MKFFVLLLFLCICIINLTAQPSVKKYTLIDSLYNSSSVLDNKTALQLIEKVKNKDSSQSVFWVMYAKAASRMYKTTKAFEYLERALKINPKNDEAIFEKAKLLYEKEDNLEEAITTLEKAISINKFGSYYFYYGIYNQLQNDNTKAILNYETAIKLKCTDDGLHRNFAILLFTNNKAEKALEVIKQGIALYPNSGTNYITMGEVYSFLLDVDNACKSFEIAYAKGYKNKNDLSQLLCKNDRAKNKFSILGDAFVKLNSFEMAIKSYTKAIVQEKDSMFLYLNRGYCYYTIKDYKNAEIDYLKAVSLSRKEEDLLYDNLSLLYFDMKDYTKSIEFSSKRITLNPKNYTAYLDRGLAYRKLKNYVKAEQDFDKSLALKPDFFRAFGYKAFLYLEQEQYQKAYDLAKKAVTINPEYGYGYVVLGEAKKALKLPDYCDDFANGKKYGEPYYADEAIKIYCK